MIEIDFSLLQRIGWKPALHPALDAALQAAALPDAHAANATPPPLRLMRLTEVHRETITVHDGHQGHLARVMPRLARRLLGEGTAVAVGDWLLCREHADTEAATLWACERLAPGNHIARRDADGRRHPVVSNVDTAFFVMGLDADFNPRRLERYLLLARDGVQSVVVLTKADLVAPDPAARAAMVADEMDALRERIGPRVAMLAVDGTSPTAALQLAPWLDAGQTVVLLGSSGAGKSTLTNTLTARSLQDTGPVRTQDHRGRHTTTSRSLHALPGGACVIDTPGLRALRPDIDEDTLAAGFEDIDRLAARCRFRDCAHGDEPGCAVREGVAPDRLRNYQKLQRELGRDTMSALDRQRLTAIWKARGREGEMRSRAKRGEE